MLSFFRRIFQDQQLLYRSLFGFLLTLSLALFMHFKEARVETLELGAHAGQYVVAQVDFQFPDREATLILKQEAVKDIGKIFRFDSSEVKNKRFEFENFLLHHRDWRQKIPKSTFEEMYNAADVVEESLLQVRLTDPRTFQKMKEADLNTDRFQILQGLQVNRPMQMPSTFWNHLETLIVRKYGFDSRVVEYILGYFKQDKWQLEEDLDLLRMLRHTVEASIPEKYTKVRAGRKIISQGEKVTERHIAMINAMKKAITDSRNLLQIDTIVSSLIFAVVITVLLFLYLMYNVTDVFNSTSKLGLLVTTLLITLILAKLTEYFFILGNQNLADIVRYPLIVPFVSIMLCVLLNRQVALFCSVIMTIVLGLFLAVDHNRFIFINLISGMSIILFSRSLRKRKEIFTACIWSWLSSLPVILAFSLADSQIVDNSLFLDFLATLICMVVTSILVVGLLPVMETAFSVMTDITLMEYMDPNSELLRRLSIEAPGTYQHSLVVGTISEAAARAIGANGLFCRVSTLYHDIGKLFNPHYFTENQMGGFNIHQLLTPLESAQVIIAHVAEGVTLAKRYHLPKSFIDIIKEHHGTTLVYFFYRKEVEAQGGKEDLVDTSQFSYPGPKPRSKESAIIMIADSVEAASRSMENPTEEAITELVEKLASNKAQEGQFDECQLTFEELGIVKKVIIKTLAVTKHLRPKYPEKT